LSELSHADITNLTEFAEHRLAAQGVNPSAGDDVTQRALAAILKGLESDQGGRVPRLVDLEDKSTFLNYVRGAISSISEAVGRKQKVSNKYRPLDEAASSHDEAMRTPAENAEISDLQDQLFPRLRTKAPRRLKRTIDAWESVFKESDRIPAPGPLKYVGEVKGLARQIITELGGHPLRAVPRELLQRRPRTAPFVKRFRFDAQPAAGNEARAASQDARQPIGRGALAAEVATMQDI
jgi:hypothetical protein